MDSLFPYSYPPHSHQYSLGTYCVPGSVPELECQCGQQPMVRFWLWY